MNKIWYHGSNTEIKVFNPNSFDLGNTFQKPGWSTFCFKDYNYTKNFTIMRTIQNLYDKRKTPENKEYLHQNRCTWDFINKRPITTKEGLKYITHNFSNTIIYIHFFDTKQLKIKGIGNDITHSEFTFRDANIKPIKIEKIILTKEELEKRIMIVSDVNKYRDELVKISKYYNRGLLSLFIKYDYTLNRQEIEKIIIAIKEKKLKIGDNLSDFISKNNIEIKKIPLLSRIKKAVLGSINKLNRKKYLKELKEFNLKI